MRVTTHHNPPVLTAWRPPGATLLLTAAAVLIFLLPTSTVRLQYDRLAITAGELWRVLSGHWTHFSLDHLVLDVLMFAVLGTLCEAITRARFYLCLFGSAVLIPAAIWLFLPQLETYRGLSGIDSALYVLLVVILFKHQLALRDRVSMGLAAAALLGFIAKVGYEVVTGSTVFLDSSGANMVPIPLAHAVGAVVGLLSGLTPNLNAIRPACPLWPLALPPSAQLHFSDPNRRDHEGRTDDQLLHGARDRTHRHERGHQKGLARTATGLASGPLQPFAGAAPESGSPHQTDQPGLPNTQ